LPLCLDRMWVGLGILCLRLHQMRPCLHLLPLCLDQMRLVFVPSGVGNGFFVPSNGFSVAKSRSRPASGRGANKRRRILPKQNGLVQNQLRLHN
jgi:hypothetical protein